MTPHEGCAGNTSLALLRNRLTHLELGELLGVLNGKFSGNVEGDSVDINGGGEERVVESGALAIAHLCDDACAEGRVAELLVAGKAEVLQATDLVGEIELKGVHAKLELREEGVLGNGSALVKESAETANCGVLPSDGGAKKLQFKCFGLRVLAELSVSKGVAAVGEGRGAETGDAAIGEMAELIGADVVELLRTSHDWEPYERLLLAVCTRINCVIEWEI